MSKSVNLCEGLSITIRRSDGRTHAAVISNIDYDTNIVKVEWFEGGETKGKEVDFSALSSLNPDIALPHSKVIKRERHSVALNTYEENIETASNKFKKRISSVPYKHKNDALKARNASSKPRLTQNTYSEPSSSSTNDLLVKGQKVAPVKSNRSVYENLQCSSDVTLRKLEQLEKNRIERRKKQADMKAEKDDLYRKNMGNPHWELVSMINDFCNKISFRPLTTSDRIQEHQITVAVRKRPLNDIDYAKGEVDILTIPDKNIMIVHEPKHKVDLTKYLENHIFKFDYAFNEKCKNDTVYKYTAQPLVKTIFEGGMATCFAYGQTGSGKTYTMSGSFTEVYSERGIYALAAADIFALVSSPKYFRYNFSVSCSFYEIYSKKVFDLLNNKANLKILEDGKQQVQVIGLTERIVTCVDDVLRLIQQGNVERASGQTSANLHSSRSHAIFQIYLRSKHKIKHVHGKFSLIDLAGNERGADTFSSSKLTRIEGAEINQSLLALKECIRALGRKGAHLPFRACKLTQVLRDSFVGSNSRTCMIALVSPGVSSCENTLNTLRYADRVKELGGPDLTVTKFENGIIEWKDASKPQEDQVIVNQSEDVLETMCSEKAKLLKIDRTVINSHRETVSLLKNTLKEAEDLTSDEFSYKKWDSVLDTGIAYLMNAKEIVEEAILKTNV